MTYRCRLWLVVAFGSSACVMGQGHGEDVRRSDLSSPQPGVSGDAGAGARMAAAGRGSAGPAGAGGASGGASGNLAAGARAAGAGGADLDSGARDGNTSDSGNDAGRAADHDAAMAGDSGSGNHTDAECALLEVAVCNPVTNEGCFDSLMMQCAVDPLATLTGYCIFYSGQSPMLGGDCLNTGVTESCPPTFTCVDGRCRELCFCDADCEAGQCCTEPLEGTGFKVCGDC